MAETIVEMKVPEALVKLLGTSEGIVGDRAYEALVLNLLRHAEISQGKAAELLGISRYDMMQLAAKEQIPSGPSTAEEVREEIEVLRRLRRAESA